MFSVILCLWNDCKFVQSLYSYSCGKDKIIASRSGDLEELGIPFA